jgi:hypothetical protein
MIDAAATAHLIAVTGIALRVAAGFRGAALSAVQVAAIAMAADQHLHPAALAQEQPRRRPFAHGNRRPRTRPQACAVAAIPPGCDDAPAFVLRHGVGHGADANCHVGIGVVPAF